MTSEQIDHSACDSSHPNINISPKKKEKIHETFDTHHRAGAVGDGRYSMLLRRPRRLRLRRLPRPEAPAAAPAPTEAPAAAPAPTEAPAAAPAPTEARLRQSPQALAPAPKALRPKD